MAIGTKHLFAALALFLLSGCCIPQQREAPLITQPMQFPLEGGETIYFRLVQEGETPEYSITAENIIGTSALFVVNPGDIPVPLSEGQSRDIDLNGDSTNDVNLMLINTTGSTAYFALSLPSGATTPTPTPYPTMTPTPGASPTATPTPGASITPTPAPSATPTPTPTPGADPAAQAIQIANATAEGQLMARFDALFKKTQACAQTEFTTSFTSKMGRAPTPSELNIYTSSKNHMPSGITVAAAQSGASYDVTYTHSGTVQQNALKITVTSGAAGAKQWLDGTSTSQNEQLLGKAESVPGNCGILMAFNGWA